MNALAALAVAATAWLDALARVSLRCNFVVVPR
jgi:hypothetical protein